MIFGSGGDDDEVGNRGWSDYKQFNCDNTIYYGAFNICSSSRGHRICVNAVVRVGNQIHEAHCLMRTMPKNLKIFFGGGNIVKMILEY